MNKPILSIIIRHRNEFTNLRHTTNELARNWSDPRLEIIIVDDASDVPIPNELKLNPNLRCVRHDARQGSGAAVDTGAAIANGDWLLILDAHMTFDANWFDVFLTRVNQWPSTDLISCAYRSRLKFDYYSARPHGIRMAWGKTLDYVCRGESGGYRLWDGDFIISAPTLGPTSDKFGRALPAAKLPPAEIPCPIGGAYFVHRDQWRRMGGMAGVPWRGYFEQNATARIWRVGGVCRVDPMIPIAHVWQGGDQIESGGDRQRWIWNAMAGLWLTLERDQFDRWSSAFSSPLVNCAKKELEKREPELSTIRQKLAVHWVRSMNEYDARWGIDPPESVAKKMLAHRSMLSNSIPRSSAHPVVEEIWRAGKETEPQPIAK